jgi:hypothetical protein
LRYNPALLTVTAVGPGAALPVGSLVQANLATPGEARISVASVTPLGAGAVELLRLTAQVPASAPYRATQLLALTDLRVNEGALPARADAALQVAAYLGDATGTGTYSALDGQRTLRVAVGLDTGLAAFLKVDPVLIADVTRNGVISSLDATVILQEAVGLDRPELPPLPGILMPPIVADPRVNLSPIITGSPGDTLTVPVQIDEAGGAEAVDLQLSWDPAVLQVLAVRPGVGGRGATLISNSLESAAATGRLAVGLALDAPLGPGGRSLLEIDFRIRPTASLGATLLDLRQVRLNEGSLLLTPTPVPGPDPTDGWLIVAEPEAPLIG